MSKLLLVTRIDTVLPMIWQLIYCMAKTWVTWIDRRPFWTGLLIYTYTSRCMYLKLRKGNNQVGKEKYQCLTVSVFLGGSYSWVVNCKVVTLSCSKIDSFLLSQSKVFATLMYQFQIIVRILPWYSKQVAKRCDGLLHYSTLNWSGGSLFSFLFFFFFFLWRWVVVNILFWKDVGSKFIDP